MTGRLDVIWTLFWHRFVPRDRQENLKLVWVFLEPAAQLAVLLAIFTLIGRASGYGRSFAFFLLGGIVVLGIVTRGMALVGGAVERLRSPQRLAQAGVFADPLAACGFTFLTSVIAGLGIAVGIAAWQHVEVRPADPALVVLALGTAVMMGFGLGLVRGYSARFAPAVTRTLNIGSRALLFVSGVFYVPSFLPPMLREWLAWNPVLHAIELMRRGVYGPDYPSVILDLDYLLGVALAIAALGTVTVWANRGRLVA